MTEHVDIEVLADYAEGLLDSEESARVARHLDECERCAREHAALGDVSAVLAAAAPPAMPPEVVSRIEAAIDAEARARQTATATSEPPAGNVVPMRPRRARRWIAPLSAVAAAAVVVVGGVAIVKQVSGSGGADSGAAPASKSEPPQVVPKAAGPRFTSSGTHYTGTALAAQVNGTVQKSTPGGALGPKSAEESPGPSALPSALAGCVDRISTKAGKQPTVVDRGTYDGRPVRVLIFSHSAKYAVWIVDSRCSGHADGVVTHTTVPRRP